MDAFMDLDNKENKNIRTTFNYYRFFGKTMPTQDKIERWMAFNKEPIEDLQYKDRIYLPVLRTETKLLFQYETQGNKPQKFREGFVTMDWTSNKTFISTMKKGIEFLTAKRNEYEQNRKDKERQRIDEDFTDDEQDEMNEEEEDEEEAKYEDEDEDEEEELEESISSEEELDDSEQGDEVEDAEDDADATKHKSRERKRRNSKEEREDSDDDDDLVNEEQNDDKEDDITDEETEDDDDDDDLKQIERGEGPGRTREIINRRGRGKARTTGKTRGRGMARGRGRGKRMARGRGMAKGRRRSFAFFVESAEPEYNPGRLAAPKTKKKSSFNPIDIDASTTVETEVYKYISIHLHVNYVSFFFLGY